MKGIDPPDMARDMSVESQLGSLSGLPPFSRPLSNMSIGSNSSEPVGGLSKMPSAGLSPQLSGRFFRNATSPSQAALFEMFGEVGAARTFATFVRMGRQLKTLSYDS